MISLGVIQSLPVGLLVPHYLLASYCYYWQDVSPMTDEAFDYLCIRLNDEWDAVEHRHKHLVERGSLAAGSCFLAHDDFPLMVQLGYLTYYTRAVSGAMEEDLKSLTRKVIKRTRVPAPIKPEEPTTATVRRVSRVRPARR
jgi:hypothetical protein